MEGCARRTLHCLLLPLQWDLDCQPWQEAAAASVESRKLCVQVSSHPVLVLTLLLSWVFSPNSSPQSLELVWK